MFNTKSFDVVSFNSELSTTKYVILYFKFIIYYFKSLTLSLVLIIKHIVYIYFSRLETSANVQTTEIVYTADDTQTTDTRSIGVSLVIKNVIFC